ncbi:hypothetical protein DFP72DRAFT_883485 [Ephemerocybe angulata]|uniref:BRCT domain-containing protein n=1 Tax=Ephemerocybe angulata TaxID=980116 RepID=A0A8H6MCL2_9AGAR|nr:hypothetical protein DFP72DRAFT_883485 [Tulosesus angulatus]
MEGRSTRSRVTLSDDILRVSQESPLKKARSTKRTRTNTNSTNSSTEPAASNGQGPEDDDPLLLSPQKVAGQSLEEEKKGKRSASPPPQDEYSELSPPAMGRELKRLKTDAENLDAVPARTSRADARGTHSRNLSDSNAAPPKRSVRQASRLGSQKPNSTGHGPASSPPPDPVTGRAQSVPIFPASASLPQIDLRHPPPSPTRSRSRSPSKESTPRLRMHPLPVLKAAPSLESIPDEMNVDSPTTPVPIETPQASAPENNATEPVEVPAEERVLEPASPKVTFSGEVRFKEAETPITAVANVDAFGFSPLTPVPDTPHPTKFQATQSRLREVAALELVPKEDPPPVPQAASQPPPKASLLPRSSSSNLRQAGKPKQPAPAANGTEKLKADKPTPSTSQEPTKARNAYDVLMRKATYHQATSSSKAKLTKVAAPVLNAESSKAGSSKTAVGRIKAGMKPKARKVERTAPALVPIPVDEEESAEDVQQASRPTDDVVDIEKDRPEEIKPLESQKPDPPLQPAVPPNPEPSPTNMDVEPSAPEQPDPEPPIEQFASIQVAVNVNVDLEIEVQKPQPMAEPTPLPQAEVASPNAQESPITPPPDVTAATETGPAVDPVPTHDIEMGEVALADTQAEPEVPKLAAPAPEEKRRPGRQSKLPRLPSALPTHARATRASSTAKNKKDVKAPEPPKPKPVPRKAKPIQRSVSGSTIPPVVKPPVQDIQLQAAEAEDDHYEMVTNSAPPSPVKRVIPSPTPIASPSKSRIPVKRTHSPSPSKPSKLVRSASLFSRASSESRFTGNGSLSTLSSALEKLRAPAPSRPNTSLGFNRDLADDEDCVVPPKSQVQDDSNVGKKSSDQPKGKPAPLGRTTTLGCSGFLMKQSTLFFPRAGAGAGAGPGMAGRVKPLFGVGHGRAPKASRNPGLATVIGSPVKGGKASAMEEEEEPETGPLQTSVSGTAEDEASPFLDTTVPTATVDKGKGRQRDEFSTRRASAISHSLSESLNTFRAEVANGKGLMGPPPVPANLSARSTGSNGSPGSTAGETSSSPPGRRSTRIAAVAATQALTTASKKANEPEKPVVNQALKFLKDCVIYVDVKTDDSEEAGSLFVEMLEGVGAKILQRVGQTCTHIVYKNGLQSTINRYKLLRDPKPLVVGIAWVVDCVEQLKKVDEAEYLIDLEEVSLLTNPSKRRRSLLPKLISRHLEDIDMSDPQGGGREESNDGDVSMESASSIALDDLPPLERARRRQSMLPS